jgi:sialate O-acetylesterase
MLRLAAIFKDGAVLQRDRKVKIWGDTDWKVVYISMTNNEGTELCKLACEASDNVFIFEIGPFPAGGPYAIKISGDTEEIVLKDIYFGDVYIAGGQSNMEFELQNSLDGKREVAESNNPYIRFYYTPKVSWVGQELYKAENDSVWEKCQPGKTGHWSACGYYFAKALSEVLNGDDHSGADGLEKPGLDDPFQNEKVMIGIIGCNWGGTSAACWMSREKLLEYPETAVYVSDYDKATKGQVLEEYLKELAEYEVYQAEFDKNVGNYYATNENPSWEEAIKLFGENRYPGPMGPRNWTRPAGLYESMLKRIAPYGICGALWYQGEEDDNRPYIYKRLLQSLTEEWKKIFENKELPFYIVQLPIFKNEGEDDDKNWPFIREAQSDVCAEEENFGLAVSLESGECHNIHPLNKETAGYRLAFQALYRYYGIYGEWEACGPRLESSYAEGDSVYAEISCCQQGLVTDGDDGFLEDLYFGDFLPEDAGFEVAGVDGVYFPAKVQYLRSSSFSEKPSEEHDIYGSDYQSFYQTQEELKGGGAILRIFSERVPEPKYARYFWKNYGRVRIFGANGIPMAPFRTSRDDSAKAVGSRQGAILD